MPPLKFTLPCSSDSIWLLTCAILSVACRSQASSVADSPNSRDGSVRRVAETSADPAADQSLETRWSACHPPDTFHGERRTDSVAGSLATVQESYRLETVAGRQLPHKMGEEAGKTTELLSQTLVLLADGSYHSMKRYRFSGHGSARVRAIANSGEYRQDANNVVISGEGWLCTTLVRSKGGGGLISGDQVPRHGGVGMGIGVFVYTRKP